MTAPVARAAQTMPPASLLFPFRAWMRHPWLRSGATWTVVALVAVPPLALTMLDGRSGSADTSAVVFAAYFAVAWAMVLRIVVRPQNVDAGVLATVVALALVVEAPVAMALETLLDADTRNLILGILTVGVPEELAKLLPVAGLALVSRRARTSMTPRDFLFVGAVSGLVFGAVEAVQYVMDQDFSSTRDGLTVVWRLVAGPATHACWAGVSGYFLGLASRYREPGPLLALAGIGIGVPAVLHGANNWVVGTPAWVAVVVVSTLVFLGYARIGLVPAEPRPAPVDPITQRLPVVGHPGMPLTAAGARPTVGAWTATPTPTPAPTPRSAPWPSWRP